MISTFKIYEDLRESLDEKAARRIAHHLTVVYEDLQQTATRSDVAELRKALQELAVAQKATETTVKGLADTVQELATAQKSLETTVRELVTAQKSLEATVRELVTAQISTEATVRELAAAQKATEATLQRLIEEGEDIRKELKVTRGDLGGLTHTVGYRLEDEAYQALPRLLKQDHGVEVTGRLVRRHLALKAGGSTEINILGEAQRGGRKIHVVGESKSQLHRRDVQRFQTRKLPLAQAELGEVFPILVTYMTLEPGLEDYIRQQGIALYYSFDFAPPA